MAKPTAPFAIALSMALTLAGSARAAQVFEPLAPCRVVDTRLAGGAFAPGETRSFQVAGEAGFAAQGGASGGCGVPLEAAAVAVNLIAVGPAGPGHFEAWPSGAPMPLASALNYSAAAATGGLNVANGVIVPIAGGGGPHLDVRANVSAVFLVADVTGYFLDWTLADGPGSGLDADALDGLGADELGRLELPNVWNGSNLWLAQGSFLSHVQIGDHPDDVLTIKSGLFGRQPLVFEGTSNNALETVLELVEPTADRTITLPDASGEVSLLGPSIEGSEIADVVRNVALPLGAFRSCDESRPLDGLEAGDTDADFVTIAGVMGILWDAITEAQADESYSICATMTIPPDYRGEPVVRFEVVTAASTSSPEEVVVRVKALTLRRTLEPSTAVVEVPLSDLFAAGRTYTLRLAIGGEGPATIDEAVMLIGAELRYLAEQ
jgi:hypothetical protein